MGRPRRVSRKRIVDKVIATGIIAKSVIGDINDPTNLPEGTQVRIARIIRTPIGLRFRLFQTIRWLGEENLRVNFNEADVVDFTTLATISDSLPPDGDTKNLITSAGSTPFKVNGLKLRKSRDKKYGVSSRTQKVSGGVSPKYGKQRKAQKVMDKKDLKTAIAGLTTGDQVSVTFLSSMPSNGRYNELRGFAGRSISATLSETKKGRGKGGSQLMVLKMEDGTVLTAGTPHSDVILNITTPTGMLGHEDETEVPKTFETNAGRASELKDMFKPLLNRSGATVRITSSEEDYNGDFSVTSAELLKGRYGQIRLTLQADDGRSVQLWSYRHSGVVTNLEVLDQGTSTKTETSESTEETETA